MKTVLFLLLSVLAMLSFRPAFADVRHEADWGVKQCLECHPRAYPTHRPMMPGRVRTDLPLDKQGRMQCITCHRCIAGTCSIPKDRTALCGVCHDCPQDMACGLDTAHIGDSKDIKQLASERCLKCHRSNMNYGVCKLGNTVLDSMPDQSDRDSLKEPGDRVMLLEGKVACISCHDPYSTQQAKLFTSNRSSAMCLACHNKLEKVDHTAYSGKESACMGCHPQVWPTHKRARVDPSKVELPLDVRGDMLCMTCHDCVSGTCLLRLNKPQLCTTCHDCTQGMACVIGSAHLGEAGERASITKSSCLGCHDNSVAQTCGLGGMPDSARLNIECTSCHNPYSSRHKKLFRKENTFKVINKNRCPRNIVRNIPSCPECHKDQI